MVSKFCAALCVATASIAAAQHPTYTNTTTNSTANPPYPNFSGDPFQKYTLEANGIKASFIPYGARITELLVKDKNCSWQDIIVGYDNGTEYLHDTETNHTYFGAVVGRYANRIKNGTFNLDGQTYHIPTNEHHGEDTLHGGFVGYDQQNWTVVSYTSNSISFSFYDQAQSGFPGDILNVATYTLTDAPAFVSRLVSIPFNKATPIMLANHIYWNPGAFINAEATYILNDTLSMPYATRIIDIDGIEVPTGGINVTNGTAFDFTQPGGKLIGADIADTVNACGTGCTGYDNAFILDRSVYSYNRDPDLEVLQLTSPETGIRVTMSTNQQGLQLYSCNGQNGTIPVKKSQQHGVNGTTTYVEKYGCLVIEAQDWIDGINQPQWGRDRFQIFTPTTEPYVNYQKYQFSVHK